MHIRGIANALAALASFAAWGFLPAFAVAQQSQLPADSLQINAAQALVWNEGKTSIVELHGPISIEIDHTRLTARDAVIWLSPAPHGVLDEQRVEISLIGDARLRQDAILRTERNLLVTAVVRGNIRLIAERSARDDSASDLYRQAAALREGRTVLPPAAPRPTGLPQRRWSDSSATRTPASAPAPQLPLHPTHLLEINLDRYDTERASDGRIAFVITGGVTLRYRDPRQNLMEFQSDKVVLFSNLENFRDLDKAGNAKTFIADHVLAAYFEGDVRVYNTPATGANELQMRAEHVYYEFATDRAVLTDVVFHTVDIQKQIPIFMRAQTMRQLAQGEYKVDNLELSTSGFATPTYSLAATKAYVRVEPTGNAVEGDRVSFSADNAFFKTFGVPIFYLPTAGGTMTSRGGPLRGFSVDNSHDYGLGVRTEWGLFESLGAPAPADLDASYRLDYFDKRGPAGGLDAKYAGGFVTETTKDPWNFLGDLHAYFVNDHGTDDLGAARAPVDPPDSFRGRAYIEHQHFFPDDWQAQIRLGWVSDANFLTQWFPDEYHNGLPIDESIYLKHQKDSEVFTLLTEWQPNDVVTTAENVQEQREIERLPEVGYHRVGDSFGDDSLTFFSDNTAGGLKYSGSSATLRQQGFYTGVQPGLPSFAYTGDPGDITWRGDFRQEIDWPINAGPIKAVPYVFGRYTPYSQGVRPAATSLATRALPTGPVQTTSDQNRVMSGAGLRLTTAFWKVDNSIESDLFDVHRVRHVIEPEINLFTSAQTVDQNRLFIYDENVDAVNDVQAMQLVLRQRWQTKRGGPGRLRSVDFFTLDVTGNFFANQPDPRFRDPVDFRGLYFPTLPEASLPRNSVNFDAQWRISDTMTLLGDASHNLDHQKFATGSIGLAVQRGERLSYFVGNRYISDLNSNITSVEISYELTRKYLLSLAESFDFGQSKSVFYSATLWRKFDRFQAGVRVYYDQATNNNGFSFNLVPYGLRRGLGTDELNRPQ